MLAALQASLFIFNGKTGKRDLTVAAKHDRDLGN
jgi:hypothetical protein